MASSGWSITTRGLEGIEAQLSKLGDAKCLEPAMRESLKVLQQEASRFPPQPSRTRAKTYNTWIREKGRYSMATFRGVSGKFYKRPRTGAGVLLQASEKLLQKWRDAPVQITHGGGYIVGRVRNAASYGPYVQGEKQARFHAQTPWLTIEQIYRKHAARIQRIFEEALIRLGK